LCHFGVPDWLGDFQNPDFPTLFAEYAKAFAERYPWVRYYTPVNEIFIAATFSAQYGWWNERLASDRAFVNALKTYAKRTCWRCARYSKCNRKRSSFKVNLQSIFMPRTRAAYTPRTYLTRSDSCRLT
jgi:beta-glucosidase/6-phospho-beta-glucosidase/beta-galactosidase